MASILMQQACARSVPVSACSASPPLNAPSALTTCQTTLRIVSTMSTINASEIAQQDTSLIQAPQKNLFCRSCPSLCNYCNDENTCTICDIGFYLDYFFGETRRLCVDRCQPGRYPDNSTMECKSCLSNCQTCDNGTTCFQCTQGYVLSIQGTTYSCISTCPTG